MTQYAIRPGSSADRVWIAMGRAELDHGGPRTMTTSDIWGFMYPSLTTPTISRALRQLEHNGIVKEMSGRPNGYRLWQLAPPGRAKYGLPNEHARRVPTSPTLQEAA